MISPALHATLAQSELSPGQNKLKMFGAGTHHGFLLSAFAIHAFPEQLENCCYSSKHNRYQGKESTRDLH